MKKVLMLMVTIGIMFGLVACGGNDEEVVEPTETEDNTAVEEKSEPEEREVTEKATASDEAETDESTSEEGNSEKAEYEESSVIEEEIDVSGLDVEVETDNDNNRVILFKDGNKAVYKTVFVKQDKRLKIIDIHDDEGQVYNEVIK